MSKPTSSIHDDITAIRARVTHLRNARGVRGPGDESVALHAELHHQREVAARQEDEVRRAKVIQSAVTRTAFREAYEDERREHRNEFRVLARQRADVAAQRQRERVASRAACAAEAREAMQALQEVVEDIRVVRHSQFQRDLREHTDWLETQRIALRRQKREEREREAESDRQAAAAAAEAGRKWREQLEAQRRQPDPPAATTDGAAAAAPPATCDGDAPTVPSPAPAASVRAEAQDSMVHKATSRTPLRDRIQQERAYDDFTTHWMSSRQRIWVAEFDARREMAKQFTEAYGLLVFLWRDHQQAKQERERAERGRRAEAERALSRQSYVMHRDRERKLRHEADALRRQDLVERLAHERLRRVVDQHSVLQEQHQRAADIRNRTLFKRKLELGMLPQLRGLGALESGLGPQVKQTLRDMIRADASGDDTGDESSSNRETK